MDNVMMHIKHLLRLLELLSGNLVYFFFAEYQYAYLIVQQSCILLCKKPKKRMKLTTCFQRKQSKYLYIHYLWEDIDYTDLRYFNARVGPLSQPPPSLAEQV